MIPTKSRRRSAIGMDGVATLILSNLVLVVSLASMYCWQLLNIVRLARAAPIKAPSNATLIVLGMRLRGDRITADYRSRLQRAYSLNAENEARRILVLGGPSGDGSFSEAERGREFLLSKGVPAAKIIMEQSSRDTLENLRHARAMLERPDQGACVLITSRYHLARTRCIAAGLGLRPVLCAAEDRLKLTPRILWRLLMEAYYLHWYRVGVAWSKLTGWRAALDRVS